MAVDWRLGVAPDIIGNAINAYDQGQEIKQRREYQNALMQQHQQQIEMQKQEAAQKQQAQRRADLPLIGRLLDHAKDETSYQQAKAAAAQYGIDTSTLPPNYDPAWVEQQKTVVHALSDPVKMEALSTAGKAATDMGYKPGTPEFAQAVQQIWAAGEAKPYVVGGDTRLYTPKIGGPGQVQGGPQPGAVEDGYRFKGGNPADPNAWEPVSGGPAAAPQTPFDQAFRPFQTP